MSESPKDASKNAVETGAAYLQHLAFIQSLFNMPQEQAFWLLKQKIDDLDDAGMQMFSSTLAAMINEVEQAAQQGNQKAQVYLQGLNEIAHYAIIFYQDKQAAAPGVDTSEIEAMLEKFAQTGEMDPELLQRISTVSDQAAVERITKKLEEIGASEDSDSPGLDSRDFYRPRKTKYKLKWPLSPVVQQHVMGPFDELEPEDQFHVLFIEFTRRAIEARRALDAGDIATAEATFQECLERAKQLEVGELEVRSYEGLMLIAERHGDPVAERKWLMAAQSARQAK